jgi:hypothetical protein
MLGVCVMGWLEFVGRPMLGGADLLEFVARAVESQPWLLIGVAGVGVVQLLTFARRIRGLNSRPPFVTSSL